MLYNGDILIENIMKKGNKVLIWGACEQNNDILEFFIQNGVNVVGYIDQNADKQNSCNELPVFNKDIIRNDDYFVYVGLLKTYDEVITFLEYNEYSEFIDYWYPNRKITLDGSSKYKDLYGNEYAGENYKISITLQSGGKIFVGVGCKFGNIRIYAKDMSEIKIMNKVRLSGITSIFAYYSSYVEINERVTSEGISIASVQNSKVVIGKDCMLSDKVTIRAGNNHNLFDLNTGENLSKKGQMVIIREHVWIGYKAVLFNGCDVDNGSVIGLNTFVNKRFPQNCSIAGNPARIIKENIAWRREDFPYFDSYDDFAEFDFR